ncbi:8-amino-7-oxononanoate synthase [Oscillatoria sp. CS-180]|uniref:8-amino-7-oxononanoate synthase n=1 Tax=Oscillatoria sp. CS-180 TaxID=3021720 RepID=UPI00232AF479|nr:8-amino-7-oxononanoate synthase [Oscillatoria sp. CS-180]MDB9528801.1 8-amino-7-oxononanoate synthase [Oscillatoria sp. CS-180]
MAQAYDWIDQALRTVHRANWHRTVQRLDGKAGPTMTYQGRQVLNFASNDYLGLAGDPRLSEAAIAAIQTYGTGSTGSRLLSGHRLLHEELEQAIAQWKGVADAIVFSSGYLANMGTISALVNARDLILSDQYNHSSLLNGAKLSGATIQSYRHADSDDLKTQLVNARSRYRRCLIITDSIFSMDGDICPLPDILELADQFDCMVLVDEAHGTGVLGATGSGAVEHLGCRNHPLIQMGTLSKALGSLGGYVAGSASLIDFLRNRAPSWIYTTGLTPAAAAAALAAIRIVQSEPERRDRLWQNVHHLKTALQDLLHHRSQSVLKKLLPSESPILCLEVADAAIVMQLGQHLKQAGCFVSAVRPPTVPVSRLRLTVMATHEQAHIHHLIHTLDQTMRLNG